MRGSNLILKVSITVFFGRPFCHTGQNHGAQHCSHVAVMQVAPIQKQQPFSRSACLI